MVQLGWPRPAIELIPTGEQRLEPKRTDELPERIGPFQPLGVWPVRHPGRAIQAHDPALGREVLIWLDSDESIGDVRRHLTRPTRLRWLSQGIHDGQPWNAFLAPDGCRLMDLVGTGRPRSWAEVRPVLEHLAEELMLAEADGTLPKQLSLEKIWVRPDGSLQLLDTPLAADACENVTPLELLCRCASGLLEGSPRSIQSPPGRISAVMPRHAAKMLDRLTGVSVPYPSVAVFYDDLMATREKPTQVTPQLRAGLLGVQAPALIPLLAFGLLSSGLFSWMALNFVLSNIKQQEAAISRLESDPEFVQFIRDQLPRERTIERQIEILRFTLDSAVRTMDSRKQTLNPVERLLMPEVDEIMPVYDEASITLIAKSRGLFFDDNIFVVYAIFFSIMMIGAWILAVGWSFVFRGGWCLSIMDLILVRRDGRPAARWQCALRTFLSWAPVTGLLLACIWVKAVMPHWIVLHSGLWWAAAALLVVTTVTALVRPRRGWADYLVGIWLVPK